MHPLLSPIIDGFLNENHSPEELAEAHKVTVREVLDLLLSADAINLLRRLAQVERLRQTVLSARARSKAMATLDYLTHFDRHAKHSDCDLRRRVSEAILKQTRPDEVNQKPPQKRAPNPDRCAPSVSRDPQQVPDLVRLRAARVAAENDCVEPAGASTSPPHPSPLFETLLQRAAQRRSPSSHLKPADIAAEKSLRMNSLSCAAIARSGSSLKAGLPDDG
ncbi:MAG: hypothetical protein KF805_15750 [Phycisphaeraceae bacterium]|nr:hypothetical protein [Phycisphaeraceae bacterium]